MKKDLTVLFLREAGNASPTEEEVKAALWTIWRNPISSTSLQLTKYGHDFLIKPVQLHHYSFKLSTPLALSGKFLLGLDKHLTTPFYLHGTSKITFFGERDAIMLSLTGFDLAKYIGFYDRK
jgi:hypothetical protein